METDEREIPLPLNVIYYTAGFYTMHSNKEVRFQYYPCCVWLCWRRLLQVRASRPPIGRK